MTKEELKVMIDETINSNGARNITGKALNLALSAIVDSMGTGSNSEDEGLKRNDVNFFDYDGTLLYAYTWEEAKALTELPPLPVHDGLEVREWNYTLEDIKAQEGSCFLSKEGMVVGYVGDVVISGVSYKAYSPDGSLNMTYILTQEPQVGDSLTGALYDSGSGEYTLHEDVTEVTEVFNIIGKVDVGACVYDSDDTLLMTNNTYIIPRGTTHLYSDTLNIRWDYNFAKVLSIPATMTYIDKDALSAVCIEHLILPKGIEYGTYYECAFRPVVIESVHVNGAALDFNALCGMIIPRVLHVPNNFSSTS